jgi:hypothetical protein
MEMSDLASARMSCLLQHVHKIMKSNDNKERLPKVPNFGAFFPSVFLIENFVNPS